MSSNDNFNDFSFAKLAGKGGKLIWADEEYEDDIFDESDKSDEPNVENKIKVNLNMNHSSNSKYKVDLPQVNNLKEIPIPFAYYPGNRKTGADKIPAGIYIRLHDNVFARVVFPKVIDFKDPRSKTVPCKYESLSNCKKNKKLLARRYRSDPRNCDFVHLGEKFVRPASKERCLSVPQFGNLDTLEKDIKKVKDTDIKCMLRNSLQDVFLSYCYYDENKKPKNKKNEDEPEVLTDLDIFI